MLFQTIPPPPTLAGFVRFFWVYEIDQINANPYVYRSMADGCTEMLFHYKGRFDDLIENNKLKQSLSLLHGQSSKIRRFLTHENFGIFGVYLYPFAIPRLLSMPSSELSDEMPDLYTLLGQEGVDLEEKMMRAENNQTRLKILTQFLEKKLVKNYQKPHTIETSIQYVIHSKGLINVSELADKFSLSTRQFERKFKEFSGFSPKIYTRIIRFQSTLNQYGNKEKPLTEIAYECGYYDQSHFIHDFKQFSGYHPKQYFRGKPEGVEYREG